MGQKANNMDVYFFEQYLTDKKALAQSSINLYLCSIRKFLAANPDIDDVESYNDFLIKGSVKKRNYHYYSVLKAFIEYKIEDLSLRKNLLEHMIKAKMHTDIKVERKYLTEEKILEVINYLDEPKHRVIALIQCLTGVRVGDILRLKQGGIMPEEYKGTHVLKLALTGKGNRRYPVFIHDEMAQKIITNYITNNFGTNDFYFIEKGKVTGRPGNLANDFKMASMNYRWYWYDLKQALQTAGVSKTEFATHDFRRCFARRCWTKYKDIHILQSVLNHAESGTTLRYLKQSGLDNVDYHYEMQQ